MNKQINPYLNLTEEELYKKHEDCEKNLAMLNEALYKKIHPTEEDFIKYCKESGIDIFDKESFNYYYEEYLIWNGHGDNFNLGDDNNFKLFKRFKQLICGSIIK